MKTEAQTEMIWSKAKPTQPGKYLTRHASDGSSINEKTGCTVVDVTRRGRGLSVFCAAYNDRVPMSIIGNGELEWAAIKE
jgi:hypothetical protein